MPKRIAQILIENCVACGACRNICPRSALSIHRGCYARVDPSLCIGCGKCRNTCPANAIELIEREAEK
ncbi:MAG: 4Fe-4S binding protein [Clostridiales bacterium]|nr:4Fe-4S binding protein [Clostridiales bacterium]